jgi:hypothetical protein
MFSITKSSRVSSGPDFLKLVSKDFIMTDYFGHEVCVSSNHVAIATDANGFVHSYSQLPEYNLKLGSWVFKRNALRAKTATLLCAVEYKGNAADSLVTLLGDNSPAFSLVKPETTVPRFNGFYVLPPALALAESNPDYSKYFNILALLPKGFSFMATDATGLVTCHERQPELENGKWLCSKGTRFDVIKVEYMGDYERSCINVTVTAGSNDVN